MTCRRPHSVAAERRHLTALRSDLLRPQVLGVGPARPDPNAAVKSDHPRPRPDVPGPKAPTSQGVRPTPQKKLGLLFPEFLGGPAFPPHLGEGAHLPVEGAGVLGGGDERRGVGDSGRARQDRPGAVMEAQGQRVTCKGTCLSITGPQAWSCPCWTDFTPRASPTSALSCLAVGGRDGVHRGPCAAPHGLSVSLVQMPPAQGGWTHQTWPRP